jgi:ribonuclease HII
MRGRPPGRQFESALAGEHGLVAAVDEVGRGALAGPVTVGVVLVDTTSLSRRAPAGLRDSKLLTPQHREALVPAIQRWVLAHAVGHASAEEIDAVGIITALRRAGERALAALPSSPGIILLDGSHDWLRRRQPLIVEQIAFDDEVMAAGVVGEQLAQRPDPHPDHDATTAQCGPVMTKVKADLTCASVAAASVLAKVERDALMTSLDADHPEYGWRDNKGYASPSHREALDRLGCTPWHRTSWRLLTEPAVVLDDVTG